MKSTIIVLLLACPFIAQAGSNKVQRKVIAKPAVQARVIAKRPAPASRQVAAATAPSTKVIQETTLEIDEGD